MTSPSDGNGAGVAAKRLVEGVATMDWLWWVAGALLLAVLEVFTLDLLFIMLAAGAAAGAISAAAGLGTVGQIVLAAVVALGMMLVLRPFLLKHLRTRVDLVETNSAALIGKPGTVLQSTDEEGGRVKIVGEVWSARAEDGGHLDEGAAVRVVRIDGATAVVSAEPQDDPAEHAGRSQHL